MNASASSYFERVGFWQRLTRAMLLFFVPFMLAAMVPAAVTIIFGVATVPVPQAAGPEMKPAPEPPRAIPDLTKVRPSLEDISDAWKEIRSSNDIVLLTNFAVKFPNTSFADQTWNRINELVKSGGLQVASLNDNVDFIATLIEHQDRTLTILDEIVKEYNLENKYPLGFAIFYGDGHKLINYGRQKQDGAITFDPSALTLTFDDNKSVCINTMPIRINGRVMNNFSNVCFGGSGSVIHAIRFDDQAAIDIEPLGKSQRGVAWVIGMRPV